MFGSGLVKGLGITLRRAVSRPVTELYPFEHKVVPASSRSFLAMRSDAEGVPLCKACNTCVTGCPDHVLTLAADPEDKRRVLEFTVDSGLCCYCGLCVEACPFGALHFTGDYERATQDRAALVYRLVENGRATGAGEEREG